MSRCGAASSSGQSRGVQQDTAFHIRALEYCSAILRLIADAQCSEWTDDLIEAGIVPTMLEALNQTSSYVVRKQALGTLTSLASIRDSHAPEVIAAEGNAHRAGSDGCGELSALVRQLNVTARS